MVLASFYNAFPVQIFLTFLGTYVTWWLVISHTKLMYLRDCEDIFFFFISLLYPLMISCSTQKKNHLATDAQEILRSEFRNKFDQSRKLPQLLPCTLQIESPGQTERIKYLCKLYRSPQSVSTIIKLREITIPMTKKRTRWRR